MTTIIRLEDGNHEIKEKSIELRTIFGSVYASKKLVKYINEDTIEVPIWIFEKNGKNPCQMVTGFIR